MAVKIGTIQGRHPLPVDEYLVTSEVEPGDSAYEQAFESAKAYAEANLEPGSSVAVYYTGLTEVTLGVGDGFDAAQINVQWWRFDAASGKYVPLVSRRRRWVRCPFSLSGRTHAYQQGSWHCSICGAV